MGHVGNGRVSGHVKDCRDLQSGKNHKAISGSVAFLGSLFVKGCAPWIGRATILCTLILASLSNYACHCPWCGPQTEQRRVLNGAQLPQDQKWLVSTNLTPPFDVETKDKVITLNTIGVLEPTNERSGNVFMWFYRKIPFDFKSGFSIEFRLQVHKVEQPHNFLDSGIMFYGSIDTSAGTFAEGPRSHMIFFDEDAIGWGDETEIFKMDTTDTFHTYTLTVENKKFAKVYVDGTLALQRKDWVGIPRIGFGDMTNDLGLNGKFSIGDILVTGKKD